ncbi:MAG: hypothetical protein WCO23_01140 [bacterium]
MDEIDLEIKKPTWKIWEKIIFVIVVLLLGVVFWAALNANLDGNGHYSSSDFPLNSAIFSTIFLGFFVLLFSLIIVKRLKLYVLVVVIVTIILGTIGGGLAKPYSDYVVNNRLNKIQTDLPLEKSLKIEKLQSDSPVIQTFPNSILTWKDDRYFYLKEDGTLSPVPDNMNSALSDNSNWGFTPDQKYLVLRSSKEITQCLCSEYSGSTTSPYYIYEVNSTTYYKASPDNASRSLNEIYKTSDGQFLVQLYGPKTTDYGQINLQNLTITYLNQTEGDKLDKGEVSRIAGQNTPKIEGVDLAKGLYCSGYTWGKGDTVAYGSSVFSNLQRICYVDNIQKIEYRLYPKAEEDDGFGIGKIVSISPGFQQDDIMVLTETGLYVFNKNTQSNYRKMDIGVIDCANCIGFYTHFKK